MALSPRAINSFIMFKLPSAYLCGVRVKSISPTACTTAVRLRWINQNPFRSMFWAVQGMAAELSTGALVMQSIRQENKPISMLVVTNRASFFKKATGKITFRCSEGSKVNDAIQKAIETKEGQTCWLQAEGLNAQEEVVSRFEFEWTIKLKSQT